MNEIIDVHGVNAVRLGWHVARAPENILNNCTRFIYSRCMGCFDGIQ